MPPGSEVNLIVVSSRRLVFFLTGTDGGRSPTANQRQKRVKITPRKKMSLKTKHDSHHEYSFRCVAVSILARFAFCGNRIGY